MNWEAIAAIGQMLGSVAVFVTLIYLAVQLRQGRDDARRALSQSRGEAYRDITAMECDERYLAIQAKGGAALAVEPTGFIKVLMEEVGLTDEEGRYMFNVQLAWFNYRLRIIPYVDELPNAERHAFDLAIRATYGQPAGIPRLFYEAYIQLWAPPDAVRYIDTLLAQPTIDAARRPNASLESW